MILDEYLMGSKRDYCNKSREFLSTSYSRIKILLGERFHGIHDIRLCKNIEND